MTDSRGTTDSGVRATRRPPPAALTVAAVLLVAEALGLCAVSVLDLWEVATAEATVLPRGRMAAAVLGVAGLVVAGLLIALAAGLASRRAWARNPTVVAQLLALPQVGAMITGGQVIIGVVLLIAAAAIATAVLLPASRAALA